MSFTTEVLIFPASNEARANPIIGKPAYDIVLKRKGVHQPVYYGIQIEEPQTHGYTFLHWDSYEDHAALMNDPSYPELLKALEPALDVNGKPEMYHVEFSSETIAFEQPVTEVLVLTLKAPENRDAVVGILTKLSEATEKMLVFGKTREDDNKYIIVGGWKTVQDHWDTVAAPEVVAVLQELYSLANKDHLYHANLLQYSLPV